MYVPPMVKPPFLLNILGDLLVYQLVPYLIEDNLLSEQLADDKLMSAQLPRPVVVVALEATLPKLLLLLVVAVAVAVGQVVRTATFAAGLLLQ